MIKAFTYTACAAGFIFTSNLGHASRDDFGDFDFRAPPCGILGRAILVTVKFLGNLGTYEDSEELFKCHQNQRGCGSISSTPQKTPDSLSEKKEK